MNHSCEDHGHHCPICEEERLEEEARREVEQRVESWLWNVSIFDIYDELKHKPESYQRSHLKQLLVRLNEPVARKSVFDLVWHLLGESQNQFDPKKTSDAAS